MVELENRIISIKAAANGQFTIGCFSDGQPMAMLFGHPVGKGPSGIFSSYVSVKIDDAVFKLHELPSGQISRADKKKIQKDYTALDGNVIISEVIEFSEADNYSRIPFQVRNNDATPHVVGLRILLDTWAGTNDGVPFRIPAADSKGIFHPGEVLTHEMEITGINAEYFEACELGAQEKIIIRGDFQGKDSLVPDRLILASWPSAYASVWDYQANPFMPIVFDSSVLIYYDPAVLKPKALKTFSFRYGLDKVTDNIEAPKVVSSQNSVFVTSAGYYNTSAEPQDVTFEVYPEDNKIIPLIVSAMKVTAHVEAGKETVAYFTLKVSGLDKGTSVLKYRISDSTGMKEYRKEVKILDQPVIMTEKRILKNSKKLPISFALFRQLPQNEKLYAVVYNAQAEIVKTAELRPEGTAGIYSAEIDMDGRNEKEVTVSIYEVGAAK